MRTGPGALLFIAAFAPFGLSVAQSGRDLDERIIRKEMTLAMNAVAATRKYEDLVDLVRDAERVGPLIAAYYRDKEHKWKAPRIREFGAELSISGTMYFGTVEFEDFSTRQAAFEKVGNRFLFDWESWVGYSEWSWRSFLRNKPSKPFVVRARIKPSVYYNYRFNDEAQWSCFVLESPDAAHFVYGYVKRESKLLDRLRAAVGRVWQTEGAVTLRVRYPPGEKQKNQLEITEFVAPGWIVTGEQLKAARKKPAGKAVGEEKVPAR